MRLEGVDPEREEAEERKVSKKIPVNETEVAMVMASRVMVAYLAGRQVEDEAFVEALLAEAETSLQLLRHEGRPRSVHGVDLTALEAALAAMAPRPPRRVRPEEPVPVPLRSQFEPMAAAPVPGTIEGIDTENDFKATHGWALLRYSSLDAYARERLGFSLSSVEHRITLA